MYVSELFENTPPMGDLLPQEAAAFALLEKLRISYTRVSHDPAGTMELCEGISRALGVPVCKNLFLCNRQKTDFYLLTLPPDKPFHTKDLSHQIGSARLSFAPEEDLLRLLGVTPGSATVLGLMNDRDHRVRLLMDREIYESEYVSCHPCINTGTLKIRTADLLKTFFPYTGHAPTVVDL